MAQSVVAPVGRSSAVSRVRVESAGVARPSQHWGERAVALVLAFVAVILNATLVGALVGMPLFLLAMHLMMESLEQ
jgi:hypothetical protein